MGSVEVRNEPIVTNTYINTLDLSKPASNMSYVSSEKNDSTFIVSWSGTDTGSGIRDYTIYVSENGKDYSVWQYNTTETSAEFIGSTGATYRFYCIATDNVGNREDVKPPDFDTGTPLKKIPKIFVEQRFDSLMLCGQQHRLCQRFPACRQLDFQRGYGFSDIQHLFHTQTATA